MATTKVDFERELRGFYAPARTPALVEVPELAFVMVDGHGDPNTSAADRDTMAEGPTIAGVPAFIADHGCRRVGKHHEVGLGDPTRCAPEKLKTIIRQPVR